jgi:hypothetical protein
MQATEFGVQIASIVAFLFYGPLCLFSKNTIIEFKRYGLLPFRKLTGVLEILGAIGLILGFYSHILLVLASAGLALLMLLGMFARIRIKDPLIAMLPAFMLFVFNLFLLIRAI